MSVLETTPLQVVLLGAGNRGANVYGKFALSNSHMIRFVAVADANPARRDSFAREHHIPQARCFASWEELLAQSAPIAQSVVIALPDHLHETSALAALQAGYNVLLEKPIATTPQAVIRIGEAARNRLFLIGYVLRFAPFFRTVKSIIDSGRIGEIVTLNWQENVSSIHYAHSYVRGNWSQLAKSSPMILAKCSHDLDLLLWLTSSRVKTISSFGNLFFFRKENAPDGSTDRCVDQCLVEANCSFSALKLYLGERTGWPVNTIAEDTHIESRRRALETGPYGRCVYRAENDVVDHQVIAFEFENGATGTFTMHGHSGEEGRSLRIDGTRATLRGVFSASKQEIQIEDHDERTAFSGGGEKIPLLAPQGMAGGGHGGGDEGLMHAFIEMLVHKKAIGIDFVESHLMAFAAEQSRLTSESVDFQSFISSTYKEFEHNALYQNWLSASKSQE